MLIDDSSSLCSCLPVNRGGKALRLFGAADDIPTILISMKNDNEKQRSYVFAVVVVPFFFFSSKPRNEKSVEKSSQMFEPPQQPLGGYSICDLLFDLLFAIAIAIVHCDFAVVDKKQK